MNFISTKERVLRKIDDALVSPMENPYPELDLDEDILQQTHDHDDIGFAENFVRLGGEFRYCASAKEMLENLRVLAKKEEWIGKVFCADSDISQLLNKAGIKSNPTEKGALIKPIAFFPVYALVAATGSVVYPVRGYARYAAANAKIIVFVATVDQLVPEMKEAYRIIKKNAEILTSVVSVFSGFSKAVDMNGEEFQGFGAKEVYLFLIEQE
jgi:L-lactate dehydrogenase complex protein LldG